MISIPYMGKVEFLPRHYMVDIQFQFPIWVRKIEKDTLKIKEAAVSIPYMGKKVGKQGRYINLQSFNSLYG